MSSNEDLGKREEFFGQKEAELQRQLAAAEEQRKKAAEEEKQGDAAAQFNLGDMYSNGQGVSRDDKEAVKWYTRAAEQGYAAAQNNLGFMYQNGQGVDQDYEKAKEWYKKAADQGNAVAIKNLKVVERKIREISKAWSTPASSNWGTLAPSPFRGWGTTPVWPPIKAPIPDVARGYEAIYERFLKGKLIYKPDEKSDKGRIELRIADLRNPLEGEFDLSKCGVAGKYLSINTGYRKGKRPENANKVEIWFAPRFLIEKNLAGSASHFKGIMGSWDARTAPVGTFFTWGGWDNLGWYDYANKLGFEAYNDHENNLSNIHSAAVPRNFVPWPITSLTSSFSHELFSCHF